ncbi:J domain-containing protein [Sphingomonas sp.]|uniref:J domain-containing protein n=1 Tax=Sphingomonas sp. TaxID=28214 RepID=UPI0025EAED3E|nr:J domain-containing protein [Sphingomonas sp.]MBV9528357.1 J domain-containing protein [Sphingomonas sp.]
MVADASAYAVLGLEPGAEWAAVERAYKTLIKAYHPDRPGGDADRAAEINHAYRELRRARAASGEGEAWGAYAPIADLEPRSWRWLGVALGIAGVAAGAFLIAGPSASLVANFRMRAAPLAAERGPNPPLVKPADAMAEPLDGEAIRAGVAQARHVAATGSDAAMADATRNCASEQRARPSLALLDRCAAFDDAIVQLEDRDPWRDDGPFSQLAVTGRQTSAANLLSDDYLAIDSRLDRIRLAVELALSRPEL